MRNKTATTRPRPKTIHVDAGTELDSGALTPSRGKKGSSSNLSTGIITNLTFGNETIIHCNDQCFLERKLNRIHIVKMIVIYIM